MWSHQGRSEFSLSRHCHPNWRMTVLFPVKAVWTAFISNTLQSLLLKLLSSPSFLKSSDLTVVSHAVSQLLMVSAWEDCILLSLLLQTKNARGNRFLGAPPPPIFATIRSPKWAGNSLWNINHLHLNRELCAQYHRWRHFYVTNKLLIFNCLTKPCWQNLCAELQGAKLQRTSNTLKMTFGDCWVSMHKTPTFRGDKWWLRRGFLHVLCQNVFSVLQNLLEIPLVLFFLFLALGLQAHCLPSSVAL